MLQIWSGCCVMEKHACGLITILILCWLLSAVPCRAGEQVLPDNHASLGEDSGVEAHQRGTVPREWLARTPRTRDPSLVVSVEAVLGKPFQTGETVLVDVRDPAKYAGHKIPGSISLPLFSVKTKTYLKDRTLVLFSEGYSYHDLEEECRRLRALGFNASILDGGLRRWTEGGGPVEGRATLRDTIVEVPPQVFFQERHYENWVVIDVSESGDGEMPPLLPEAYPIDLGKGLDGAISRLRAIGEQNQHKPFLAFLIVNRDGEGYERLDRLMREAGLREVYFLEGGLQTYEAFLIQQAALLDQIGRASCWERV